MERSLFQALPLQIDQDVNLSAIIFSPTPWNTIRLSAVRGGFVTDPSSGEAVIIVNGEWPTPLLDSLQPLAKRTKERMHLNRYCTDHLVATGTLPYTDIAEGSDPPDFTAEVASRRIGIDCSQLTLPDRRNANGLFCRVREAILREPRERFVHLTGLVIYMWFDKAGTISLPPKRTDHVAIQEIVNGLAKYHFDPENSSLPSAELPNRAPDLNVATTPFGCNFYAMPMANAVPSTRLFEQTGFELGLAFTTAHRRTEITEEIVRLVTKHDKAAIDHLIITVGGPDEQGISFPSEQVLAEFALDGWTNVPAPAYLSRTTIHFWSTGAIVEITPEYRVVSGHRYEPMDIPHYKTIR